MNTIVSTHERGRHRLNLPLVLAGPIIRRVEPTHAYIWLALREPLELDTLLYIVKYHDQTDSYEYEVLPSKTETESVKVGTNLYIYLVKVSPLQKPFPKNSLIGYNIEFKTPTKKIDLGDLGLLSPHQRDSIVYGNLAYPTFYINESEKSPLLYGSCRKPHGEGFDVLAEADQYTEESYDTDMRPAALFLMGDQIYADDVAGPLFHVLNVLGKQLIGYEENFATIEPRMKDAPFQKGHQKMNGRQFIMEHFCKFTSRNASNHLMALGEYAAMYIMTWSPALWRVAHKEGLFKEFDNVVRDAEIYLAFDKKNETPEEIKKELNQLQTQYQKQAQELASFEDTIPAVRRLLANTPTYMIFDDHDITDDWNLTEEWKTTVWKSPLGRHVISNGIAGYWLFQGWGNDPEQFSAEFKAINQRYYTQSHIHSPSHHKWMDLLWSFQFWSFVTPTSPHAVFLDTRTQRGYESTPKPVKIVGTIEENNRTPRLINEEGWNRIDQELQYSSWSKGKPLLIISPTPLYGIGLIENFLKHYVSPIRTFGIPVQYTFDLEAWKYNGKGFYSFLQKIAQWNPKECFILSGDVHSASAVKAEVMLTNNTSLTVHQFTSSPIKNRSYSGLLGSMMKMLIQMNSLKRKDKTLYRYCSDDYQLHLSGKQSTPSNCLWNEEIRYLPIDNQSIFEPNNNLGLFTYTPQEISNTLLKEHKALTIPWNGRLK